MTIAIDIRVTPSDGPDAARTIRSGKSPLKPDNESSAAVFPVGPGAAPRLRNIHEMSSQLRARRMRVLVVEDNAAVLTLTCALVEKVAAEIYTAANGEEAVAQFAALRPDLVLMDICMPGMDGRTAASLMRRYETFASARTPIIAMSAAAVDDLHPGGLHADFNSCLVKPFTRHRLYEALLTWLPAPSANGLGGPALEHPADECEMAQLRDYPNERIRELVEQLGPETVMRIIAAFDTEMQQALAGVQRAYASGDQNEVCERVHFILGGAANLGLMALVAACAGMISAMSECQVDVEEALHEIAMSWSADRAMLSDWQLSRAASPAD